MLLPSKRHGKPGRKNIYFVTDPILGVPILWASNTLDWNITWTGVFILQYFGTPLLRRNWNAFRHPPQNTLAVCEFVWQLHPAFRCTGIRVCHCYFASYRRWPLLCFLLFQLFVRIHAWKCINHDISAFECTIIKKKYWQVGVPEEISHVLVSCLSFEWHPKIQYSGGILKNFFKENNDIVIIFFPNLVGFGCVHYHVSRLCAFEGHK